MDPFQKKVDIEVNDIQEAINKNIARIKSTEKLKVAWSIVTFKVTKTIWNNDVPIATTVPILKR